MNGRKVLAVLSAFAAVCSSFFVMAAISDLITGGDGSTPVGVLMGLLVFFGGTMTGSGFLAKRLWSGAPRVAFDPVAVEHALLSQAQAKGGRLTVAEVAIALKVPVSQAKAALDHLVTSGVADLLVSDSGEIVYRFAGLINDDEKHSARDLFSVDDTLNAANAAPKVNQDEFEQLLASMSRK